MANMMKLTVKTLDSMNHVFHVATETTVEQFKQNIREKLGLDIELQRLIFGGRVLQDDQKLTDCGVNDGKCLHLVQRPPPSPPSRRRERQRARERERENARREAAGRRAGASPPRHHIRHLLANPPNPMFDQQLNNSMSPTNWRMEFIRRIISEIRESMEALRGRQNLDGSGETGEPPFEPMDIDSEQNEVPLDQEGFENDDEEDNDDPPGSGTRDRRSRPTRVTRARYSRPRDLGLLLEELDLLHDDFAPYRAQYVVSLRDLNAVVYPEPERTQRQQTYTLICDVMHSFAHAYHAISDITYHVSQRYPRLTSEPPAPVTARNAIPMQAHVNVVTTTGRRSMSGDGRAAGAPTRNTTTPAPTPAPVATGTPGVTTNVTSTPAPPPNTTSAAQEERDTFNVRRSNAADQGIPTGTPIHTTTSTFTHATEGATPRRYQVEIATRGHIAFPIDNSLLNGLAAVASNLHQAEQTQEQFARQVESLVAASASAEPSVPSSIRPDSATRSEPSRTERRSERVARPPRTPSYLNHPHNLLEMPDMLPTRQSAPIESDSSDSSIPPPEGERRSSSMPSIVPPNADEGGDAAQRESQPTAPPSQPHVPGGNTRHEHGREGTRPEANRTEQERPRVLTDVENLLRNFSQNGGVEVVLSMNDMHGLMHGNFESDNDHEVYISPMMMVNQAGGTNHATEFLHNIVNVVRQNIGGAFLVQGQNVTGLSGQNQQAQSQRQTNTTQRQAQSQRPTTDQRQTSGQGQTPNQGQNQNPRHDSDQGPNQQNRNAGRWQQWQVPRNTTGLPYDRVRSLMRACMVYDRHLPCDSQHARRHLQERRDQYQQEAEGQERNRAARAPAAPVLEVLMSRNRRFSPSHMEEMMRLLGGPVCEEGQLNAFMITIARHSFLDPMNEHPNDPTSMPSEFPFIRMQLREYVQGMLNTAVETGGHLHTFEAVTRRVIVQNLDFLRNIPREHVPLMVDLAMLDDGFSDPIAFDPIADHYVERHSDFLRNMGTITPIDTEIDTILSVRVMTRSRLPAIIACVMSEASSDMYAARFYSVFARFFTDMCTLFLCFCTEGFDGLLLVFDAYIARITENYEPLTRDWLRTISRANLIAILDNLESNIDATTRQYVRRVDGSMPLPRERRAGNAPAELFHEEEEDESDDADTLGRTGTVTPPFLRTAVLPRVDGDSTTTTSSMSPELRSPGEPNLPRSESLSPRPRPFRGWDNSSPSGPRVPSDEEIMPNPGGIITIGLGSTSNSSLYDPDENSDNFIDADAPDDYEFIEMQRTILDRQLHLIEDEESQNVDVVNDDGTPVHLPGRSNRPDPYVALSQAAMRVTASRMRWQAMRHGRLEPSTNAVRQAELRVMEQTVRDFEADTQLIAAMHRLQSIADRQARDVHGLPDNLPQTRRINTPPPEPDSLYSTPPANSQPEEPEFLEPNEPDPAHSPTIHPIYHIDMSEPEFLVPINNLRNRLNYAPNNDLIINEQEPSSPDADRLIINEDVDFFSYSDSDTRGNESGENSGYLTPFTRNRADVDPSTPLSMQRTESNEFMPEAPRVDNNDSTGTSSPLEFSMHPLQRLERSQNSLERLTPSPDVMEDLTPSLDASQMEAMTLDFESGHLRSQCLQDPYECNEESQTYPSTVLENMTSPEAPRGVDNDDAGPSGQLEKSQDSLECLTPSPLRLDVMETAPSSDVIEVLTPSPDVIQIWTASPDVMEISTPAPDASQLEVIESEHLRSQNLQSNKSSEETEINLPTESKNNNNQKIETREVDSNDDMAASPDLAMRPRQKFEKSQDSSESLTPPPESQLEAITPVQKTEPSHAHSLHGLSEGNEDTQTNPPIVPENENVDSISSNQDAAIASAQAPMDSVFEHFESNWAPVFREDEAAQARPSRPQEPFSDAYLSGMPSRKRRCVQEARPDPSLEGLMTGDACHLAVAAAANASDTAAATAAADAVAAAAANAVCSGVGETDVAEARSEDLREFLRESVRSLVINRSQCEPENFSISQFQNAAAFIDADKPTNDDEEVEEEAASTSELPQGPAE